MANLDPIYVVAPRVCLSKVPFLAIFITMVTIFHIFLAHILSGVKICDHAKFPRNLLIGLTRIIHTYVDHGHHLLASIGIFVYMVCSLILHTTLTNR